MNGTRRRKRVTRWLLTIAGVTAGSLLLIEILARINIFTAQREREPLGDRLYTEVSGSGDPIVLMAGLQGTTRYWGTGFDSLAADRRLIKVDLLGFGQSPWPDLEYTLDDHLAYLRRTLVAKGATSNVVLVAHSFGTIIAAAYAARYPDEILHLYLLGTPVYDSEQEARKRIWDMSSLAAAFSLQPVLARETCLLMGSFRPLFRGLMPAMSDLPRAVAEDSVLHSWPSMRGALENVLLSEPIATFLTGVGRKTTFIHGTRDVVTPLDRVRSLSREVGGSVVSIDVDHQGYATVARERVLSEIALH